MKAVKNSHWFCWVAMLPVFIVTNTSVLAYDAMQTQQQLVDIRLNAGAGFYKGDLQWSIASDITGEATPNILSELTYSDVEYETFAAEGMIRFNRGSFAGVSLQGRYLTGEASSGTNQDSDYNGNNRTEEYSRSLSDADGSEITEFELIFGYRFTLNEQWSITPKFAYSYNEQMLKMTDGVQILDTRVNALSLGPFTGNLNSSYTAEWEGFWAGGELAWQWQRHLLTLELQAHYQDYYAEANWNLREDFAHPVSFAHWSEGTGTRWKLRYQLQFARHFSAWVQASAEDFEADPGRDVVYFADGDRGATRLNGVTWESSGYALGVEFNF